MQLFIEQDFQQQFFQQDNLINHGHVKVNGKKVNIGSYMLKKKIQLKLEINLNN